MDMILPQDDRDFGGRQPVIVECHAGTGDIVILTGVVRDLHLAHPGKYAVDVRTSYSDLWFYNPYLTSLSASTKEAKQITCDLKHLSYRKMSSSLRYSELFVREFEDALGIRISSTSVAGDIHLSIAERVSTDPVEQLLGGKVPYWLISAGGRNDLTTKFWSIHRHQAVVDHFRDRILFVQVGLAEHNHPPLRGVLDLRGRTSLRDLVRLVHGSSGVVCGITSLMHMAAAVPSKRETRRNRPCVVIAGGREPSLLVQYPGHQFIHNVDALACSDGGCWKARTHKLDDGSDHNQNQWLCTDLAGDMSRCMDMITVQDVVRRIESYFEGGVCEYLLGYEIQTARRADRNRARAIKPISADTAPSLPGPNPKNRFTLVTCHDDNMAEIAAITGGRVAQYAKRHGYAYRQAKVPLDFPRHPSWRKVDQILRELEAMNADWLLWIDADAYILDMGQPLEAFVQTDKDLVISKDCNGINAGVMLVRVCSWARKFFETMNFLGESSYSQDLLGVSHEQGVLRHLLKIFPAMLAHCEIVPQNIMNSYLETVSGNDFILHLASLDNETRISILKKIEAGVDPTSLSTLSRDHTLIL